MKRTNLSVAILIASMAMFSSCYTYTATVGKGAQGGMQITKKNHYLISGLIPINPVDAKTLAGNAENYTVTVKYKFIDGFIASLTFGIYTPTTTIITK
jgi:hypothetical protein